MKEESRYSGVYAGERMYFFDKNQIDIDDFFRLEYTAAIENELMKHKIFFAFKLDEGFKVFTSLN